MPIFQIENEISRIHAKLESETDGFARNMLNLKLRTLLSALDRAEWIRESYSDRPLRARARRLGRLAA